MDACMWSYESMSNRMQTTLFSGLRALLLPDHSRMKTNASGTHPSPCLPTIVEKKDKASDEDKNAQIHTTLDARHISGYATRFIMSSPAHLFGRLHDAIRASDRVLLIAHKKPDGDTLGSSSSILNWLLREKKDVTAFCRDAPPACFQYLDNVHRYTSDPTTFDRAYDVVIVFDAGDLRYCGVSDFMSRLPTGYLLVNIDHHVTNERFGHLNLVLTDASSTAEIIHRFYDANGIHVDHAMATSILTGIFTDTSSFSNAATNQIAVEAASKMLSVGGRLLDIHANLLHDKTVSSLNIWGLFLSRLRYNATYDVVSTYMRQEDVRDVPKDVIEGVSNFLNAVTGGTDTILVLHELTNGMVKGSFRSVTRDVSKVARILGGGGHKKAAGFTVAGRIEETADGPRIVAISKDST